MVGAPGKSIGCNTCKKRKIACDGTKPHCQKCRSTGRQCEGYEKYPSFMVWTPQGYQKRSRLEEFKPPTEETSSSSTHNPLSLVQLPRPLTETSVWDDKFRGLFLDTVLGSDNKFAEHLEHHWLTETFKVAQPCDALRFSVSALSTARVAWKQEDRNLKIIGEELYGKALRALQQAICSPDQALHDHTFLAAKVLIFYEVIFLTSKDLKSWQAHTSGLISLLRIRGSKPFDTTAGVIAFRDVRTTMMIRACMYRRQSPIEREKWVAIAGHTWAVDDNRICDVGFMMGQMFEDFDTLRDQDEHLSAASRDKLSEILSQILWNEKILKDVRSATQLYSDDTTNRPLVSVATATRFLHACTLSLVMRMLLDSILQYVREGVTSFGGQDVAAQSVLQALNDGLCLDLIREVLAISQIFVKHDQGILSAGRLLFPLLAALYRLNVMQVAELDECGQLVRRTIVEKGALMGLGLLDTLAGTPGRWEDKYMKQLKALVQL